MSCNSCRKRPEYPFQLPEQLVGSIPHCQRPDFANTDQSPYLHSMLIGSSQELGIILPEKDSPSLQNIGDHHAIQVTNMRGFHSKVS